MIDAEKRIAELERSHAELRGALIFAGRRIQKLTRYRIGREPSLPVLRNVLRDARAVSKKHAAPLPAMFEHAPMSRSSASGTTSQ